jgi:hypothetical protein
MNNLLKGFIYEKIVLDHILSNKLYDQAWLWKDTPESVLMNTSIYEKFINYPLYRYDMTVNGIDDNSRENLIPPNSVPIVSNMLDTSHNVINLFNSC